MWFGDLAVRTHRLAERLAPQTLCHFDVRDDNLLIRPDGSAAILDWGMARLGPAWVDPLLLALQRDAATVVRHVRGLDAADLATDLLIAFAGSQSWNAQQPARDYGPSRPTAPTTRDECSPPPTH